MHKTLAGTVHTSVSLSQNWEQGTGIRNYDFMEIMREKLKVKERVCV